MSQTNYVPTIGIECHVQLKTLTKLFEAIDNDARVAAPNTLVSPVSFGMPGALPVLNAEAVRLAIRAGIALNAEIAGFSKFDRKHYFYPDLPKGYQITQFDQPTVLEGYVELPGEDGPVKVRIERAHLEEDAGKSAHPAGTDFTLVDLNRAGTPLLEIVSRPDITSPQMARAYAQELYYLMKYADVSNVDLYHGNMRFDVNVSVAPEGSGTLGTRTEIKNLNSFKSVERAAEYEIQRQIMLLKAGEKVTQETRGWDEAAQKTVSQRGKEEAHDYRYFPEPDLPPVVITKEQIERERAEVEPRLPSVIRAQLREIGLEAKAVTALLEQDGSWGIGYVGEVLGLRETQGDETALFAANWFLNVEPRIRSEAPHEGFSLSPEQLAGTFALQREGKLSSSRSKELLTWLLEQESGESDVERIASEKNWIQSSDTGEMEQLVDAVIGENPKAADDVRAGEMKAIGFLVGQVMQKSRGQANPQIVQQLIRSRLQG